MGYDVQKHLVSRGATKVDLKVGEDIITVTIKTDYSGKPNVPWSLKNQLVSQCVWWDENRNSHFDSDRYIRECLKYMVVEAPWGETNDIFLSQVGDELGEALKSIVPPAFESKQSSTPSVEDVKKVSHSS